MDHNQAAAIISIAHKLADQLTQFYVKSVGKAVNTIEEFSILVDWHDAIEAATVAALSIRSLGDVSDMERMSNECEMWLSHLVG
jgi:hypothetical protein